MATMPVLLHVRKSATSMTECCLCEMLLRRGKGLNRDCVWSCIRLYQPQIAALCATTRFDRMPVIACSLMLSASA